MESAEGGDAAAVHALGQRLAALEATTEVPEVVEARMDSLRDGLAGALGKLEGIAVELAATKSETGAGRQLVEQRLADTAAELMAARTDAEQARKGLEGLREELGSLREYAAAAKAEAIAAKEVAASIRRSGAADDRALEELRLEVRPPSPRRRSTSPVSRRPARPPWPRAATPTWPAAPPSAPASSTRPRRRSSPRSGRRC